MVNYRSALYRIIDVLTGHAPVIAGRPNLMIIDLASYAIERLSVQRRKGCQVCGRQKSVEALGCRQVAPR